MRVTALRIAVLSTNNDRDWSGGRYHGMMLALAAAAAGGEVVYVTDRRPVFLGELAPLAAGRLAIHTVQAWSDPLADIALDWVVVVPTGIFHPEFYEAALGLAATAGARVALVNFETPGWFNATAPEPRDPALWDDWRRAVAEGGLVLSSARTADAEARGFYAGDAPVRFEAWSPPINSPAARRAEGTGKRRSVVAFVRPADRHKGADDLLALDPAALAGCTLDLVSGRDVDPGFAAAARHRFGDVRFRVRPGDDEKFRLLAAARALVFPSRFEGFGYPPVEACFAGAEVACYDLPVLRETVGPVGHFAPVGDAGALGDALRRALAEPARPGVLRDTVAHRVDFPVAATRLAEILRRSRDAVPPRRKRSFRVEWGPPFGTAPRPAGAFDPRAPHPLPPRVTLCRHSAAGDVLLSLAIVAPGQVLGVACAGAALTAPPLVLGNGPATCLHLAVAPEAIGQSIALTVEFADGAEALPRLTVREAAPPVVPVPELTPVEARERANGIDVTLRLTHGLRANRIVAVLDDGTAAERPIFGDTATIRLPSAEAAFYLLDGDDLVELLDGVPPSARARRRRPFSCPPRRAAVARIDDADWSDGIARTWPAPHLSAVRLSGDALQVAGGSVVRLGSGRLRRVAAVGKWAGDTVLRFEAPADPATDGHPHPAELIPEPSLSATIIRRSDAAWHDGAWRLPGLARPGILAAAGPAMLPAGAALVLDSGEIRRVAATHPLPEGTVAWLDGPIAATGQSVTVLSPIGGLARLAAAASPRHLILVPDPATEVGRGSVLRWPGGGVRRVVAAGPGQGGVAVELDLAAPSLEAQTLIVDAAADRVDGTRSSDLFPTPHRPGDLAERLIRAARADGADLPPPGLEPAMDRQRILLCTLVPMTPVDQGNRAVTFRLVAHLVELGFDVDIVLQGQEVPGEFISHFGGRVRVVSAPFPDWTQAPEASARLAQLREIEADPALSPEARLARRAEAATYHPWFIVSDAVVDLARDLYRRHAYAALVCNYTHMGRVAKELELVRPLPPTVIVTHDALSRLELEASGTPLDTMYRYCTPETERDVLNAVENAVVLAISEDERRYFEAIGVERPVVLCEYDAYAELRDTPVPETAFARQRLIFHASGNPLNLAALDWFVRRCWPAILARVPSARFCLCGKVATAWAGDAPNLDRVGPVERDALIHELRQSSIAINPAVAGTGLKIKTIEAACLGLPSVCRPKAVEGLEDVADRFAIVAGDAADFVAACAALLTDKSAWQALRRSALGLAAERFDSDRVYRALDTAMGWDKGIGSRRLQPRRPRQGESPALPAIQAGRTALGADDAWRAACQGAAAVAADPLEPGGYRLLAEGLRRCGQVDAAIDAAVRAVHTSPADAESLALCAELARERRVAALDRFLPWRGTPIEIVIGETKPFRFPGRTAGFGWAWPEEWGCWTAHRQARIVLRSANPENLALVAKLHLLAADDGSGRDQIVDLFVDGRAAGVPEVPRDGAAVDYVVPLPAGAFDGGGTVTIDLWIRHPAVKREGDAIVDRRRLGVALTAITLAKAQPTKRRRPS